MSFADGHVLWRGIHTCFFRFNAPVCFDICEKSCPCLVSSSVNFSMLDISTAVAITREIYNDRSPDICVTDNESVNNRGVLPNREGLGKAMVSLSPTSNVGWLTNAPFTVPKEALWLGG